MKKILATIIVSAIFSGCAISPADQSEKRYLLELKDVTNSRTIASQIVPEPSEDGVSTETLRTISPYIAGIQAPPSTLRYIIRNEGVEDGNLNIHILFDLCGKIEITQVNSSQQVRCLNPLEDQKETSTQIDLSSLPMSLDLPYGLNGVVRAIPN